MRTVSLCLHYGHFEWTVGIISCILRVIEKYCRLLFKLPSCYLQKRNITHFQFSVIAKAFSDT